MWSLVYNANTIIRRLPALCSIRNTFHSLVQQHQVKPILQPVTVNIETQCGFKSKARLKRRCKDCFFVRRQERWYIICKTHPRHKQMQIIPEPKSTWILTHATQGKIRPW